MKNRRVWDKTNGRCWYCGIELEPATGYQDAIELARQFAVDHIIPRASGGTSELDNLRPSCRSCNCSKRDKTVEQFRLDASCKQAGIPRFNAEQLAWLRSQGFEIKVSLIIFWGETEESTEA